MLKTLSGSDQRPIANIVSFLEDISARGFQPRGIIDVGANHGYWTQMCSQIYPDAKYLLIEPQDEMEEPLSKLSASNSQINYIKAGAGAEPGILIQTIWEDLAGSSFLPEVDQARLEKGEQRPTQIVTIDSLLNERSDFHPDLVKLDIQGFELEALKGATTLFGKTELFIMETSLYEFSPEQVTTSDCIQFMAERGYDLYDITEFLRRPYDGALGQVDLAFAKRDGLLRNSNEWMPHHQQSETPTPEILELKNLHACLVHNEIDCVHDLVENLRTLDPNSDILLYDGSGGELDFSPIVETYDSVYIFPNPKVQEWGKTHRYIIDCMQYLLDRDWTSLTLVDSDQLLTSKNYSETLKKCLDNQDFNQVGVFAPCCKSSYLDGTDKDLSPVLSHALQNFSENSQLVKALESIRWKKQIVWNFNPSSVYFRDAIEEAIDFLKSNPEAFEEVLLGKISVGEEIYMGTIISALGYEIQTHPFYHSVRWKPGWSVTETEAAITQGSMWQHPVNREMTDPSRVVIREQSL